MFGVIKSLMIISKHIFITFLIFEKYLQKGQTTASVDCHLGSRPKLYKGQEIIVNK